MRVYLVSIVTQYRDDRDWDRRINGGMIGKDDDRKIEGQRTNTRPGVQRGDKTILNASRVLSAGHWRCVTPV